MDLPRVVILLLTSHFNIFTKTSGLNVIFDALYSPFEATRCPLQGLKLWASEYQLWTEHLERYEVLPHHQKCDSTLSNMQDPHISELLSLRTIRLIKQRRVCVGGWRESWGTADSWMSFLHSHRLCGPLGQHLRRVVMMSHSVLAELPQRQAFSKRECEIVPIWSRSRWFEAPNVFTRQPSSFSWKKKNLASS